MASSRIKYFLLVQSFFAICKGDAKGCNSTSSAEGLSMVQHTVLAMERNTRNKRAIESQGLVIMSRGPAGDAVGGLVRDTASKPVHETVANTVGPLVGGLVEKIIGGITKNEELSKDVGGAVGGFVGDSAGNATAGYVGNVVGKGVGGVVDVIAPKYIDKLLAIVDQLNNSTVWIVGMYMKYNSNFNRTLGKLSFAASAAASANVPGGVKIYAEIAKVLQPLNSTLVTEEEKVIIISELLSKGLSYIRYVANLLKALGQSTEDEKNATKALALLEGRPLRVKGAIPIEPNVKSQSCATAMNNINASNIPHATVLANITATIEGVTGTVDTLVGQMLEVPAFALLTINENLEPALEAASAAPSKQILLVKTAIDELVSLGDEFTKKLKEYPATTQVSVALCSLLANLA